VGGEALPVVGQRLGRFALGERAQQGVDELGVSLRFELAAGFEGVAHLHQFFDAGDDAGLFGEGWERKGQPRHLLSRYVWHPVAPTRVDSANEQIRLKPKLQELRR